jgi:hypothetical protein
MNKRGTLKPVKLSSRPSILVMEPELSASMSNHQTAERQDEEAEKSASNHLLDLSSSFVFDSDQSEAGGTDVKVLTDDGPSSGFELNKSAK